MNKKVSGLFGNLYLVHMHRNIFLSGIKAGRPYGIEILAATFR